jgi:hypothetical protein
MKILSVICLIFLTIRCQEDKKNIKLNNNSKLCSSVSLRTYFVRELAYPSEDFDKKLAKKFKLRYFPINQIPYDYNEWFSYHLFGLEQCPLDSNSREQYRLTILKSFENPICITLTNNKRTLLNFKSTNGKGGYNSGVIKKRLSIPLKKIVWHKIKLNIELSSFWKSKSFVEVNGGDGTFYILEGIKNNKYKFVVRWTPEVTKDSCGLDILNIYQNFDKLIYENLNKSVHAHSTHSATKVFTLREPQGKNN